MDRKKMFFILGIGLLMLTISFTFTNRAVLFSDLNRNGGTFMELKIGDDVNTDVILEMIHSRTNLNINQIDLENKEGLLTIRTQYINANTMTEIENSIEKEFGDRVEFLSYMSLGKPTRFYGYYLVIFSIVFCFIFSVLLILKSKFLILKA